MRLLKLVHDVADLMRSCVACGNEEGNLGGWDADLDCNIMAGLRSDLS
jgi:hypothetical protein